MFSHLILVLLPTLVISILFYSQLSDVILSNTIKSEQNLAKQTADNIGTMISGIQTTASTIVEDKFFVSLFHYSAQNLTDNLSDDTAFKQDMTAFLSSTNSLVDGLSISKIKIYVDEQYAPLYSDENVSTYDIFSPMSDIKGSYWHGIFSSTDKKNLVCPSLYLTPTEISSCGDFSVVRKITHFSDSAPNPVAYVVVYFNKATVNSILRKYLSIADSSIVLINDGDAIISSSNPNISGRYSLHYDDIMTLLPNMNTFKVATFGNERAYMAHNSISDTDWIMVSLIPVNSVLSQGNTVVRNFIFAYLLFVCVAFVIALLLSNSIANRISSVITQMNTVRSGTPRRLNLPLEMDEIGELVVTYNYMTDELNRLIQKEVQAATDLRISEFKALQSQINPHFLYNTLDMINWLSKTGDSPKVSEAVQTLSKFYKLTLNKGNIVCRIEEELNHVSLYIQLQNMRYQDKIHFIIDVPDDLLEYEIPKLVLQPIVENSIQHGIFGKETKEGTIVITGWLEDDAIIFIISDDGVGIPPQVLPHLLDGTGESKEGSNIGIYNTHKRLQLFYDTEFGLTYHSTPGVGTEVEVRIPARPFSPETSNLTLES